MEIVSRVRVLFGHQSVGRDVLEGLLALAKQCGRTVRIAPVDSVLLDAAPGVFSAPIGRNGDPASKCDAFTSLLLRPERPSYDIAMMKFCYADLNDATPLSPGAMLDCYDRMVKMLRSERPEVRLVHITMPLRARPSGARTQLKRWLRRRVLADEANALRCEFNEGLRTRYAHDPIFDLAQIESTFPDGTRCAHLQRGRSIESLARLYTHDGGHLNELGRCRAADALLETLLRQVSASNSSAAA